MAKKEKKNGKDKASKQEMIAEPAAPTEPAAPEVVPDGRWARSAPAAADDRYTPAGKLKESFYEAEMLKLQEELVKLQYWVKDKGLRVGIVFEGRDAAGKGGVIKRITETTNPRIIRIVALGIPSDREKSQWYFQRWVAELPAAGEVSLFDRSWYTRAITEYVHGFCNEEQYREFLASCPQFERMLMRSGMILLKYWFSVSDEEQERRFQQRAADPKRRWKLSPMDMKSRDMWVEYSQAKDRMFDFTDTKQSPWYVVNADDKKRARINCMRHFLHVLPYPGKDPKVAGLPDETLVGPASQVIESSERLNDRF